MDLRKLELFLAVVDNSTFTAAAGAVHISQPALSQAIRELETELGVDLFDRIGRRVQLTDAGRALIGPARQTRRDIDHARIAVEAVRGLEAGRLDIACLPTLAADPAAALIGAFRASHPGIQVRMADPARPEDLLSMVRDGTVEVAITESPRDAGALVVFELPAQMLAIVAPPASASGTSHKRAAAPARPPGFGPVRPLEDWAEASFVASPPGTSLRRLLDDAFAAIGREPRIAVETAQREAIVPLVMAGAGVALLPEATAATAAWMGAQTYGCRPAITRSIALVARAGARSPAADAFMASVRSIRRRR